MWDDIFYALYVFTLAIPKKTQNRLSRPLRPVHNISTRDYIEREEKKIIFRFVSLFGTRMRRRANSGPLAVHMKKYI